VAATATICTRISNAVQLLGSIGPPTPSAGPGLPGCATATICTETEITPGTTNRYLALIRAILRRACGEWEWIDRVPRFKLFREAEGRVRSLTPQEFDCLRRELPTHLADMAVFSVATGLRQGNVKGLEWKYVDLERKHAWIPGSKHKNGKAHAVPLNEIACAVLQKQLGKHPVRVFTFRGEPITFQASTKAWTAALKRAGIEDFRWHDLRHTFATWHRQAGTPTHELQKLGGWKTGSMVERYAHVAPEALQGAAARLDALDSNVLGYVLATVKDQGASPNELTP
jgi:integrase